MNDETVSYSDKLDEIVADCIRAEEIGEPLDPDKLVAEHPELAEQLRAFFADRDRFRQLAGGMKAGPPSRTFVPPKVRYFGDYELLEEIARGGMGVVYKARQTSLNRVVAVKMILSGHLADEDDVKRFQSEAEAAASLKHPGIVAVHEVGTHYGQHYFSMDYIEGPSLAELVRENPLPARRAAGYVKSIAAAVHYAHGQGILHRDLKPSNVLLDRAEEIHVTDFGLARRVEGDSELTRTGQILGTPSYLAPEQAEGKRALIGPGSDVYSLGAILYELLTGRPPFQSDSPVETIRQVLDAEPLSPRLLNPAVPRDLETICLKCLQKEPHKRYATAQHLADDLGRFLDGEPIQARPISRAARLWRWCKRNPAVAGLLSVASLLLISVAGVSMIAYARELHLRQVAEDQRNAAQQAQDDESVARADAERQRRVAEEALASEAAAHEETGRQKMLAEFNARAAREAQQAAEESAADLAAANRRLEEQAAALAQRQRALRQSLLKLAVAESTGNNVAVAVRNLDSFPTEIRGWPWRYAKRLCRADVLTIAGCREVAFTADGTHLVTSTNGHLEVRELPSGKPLNDWRPDQFPSPESLDTDRQTCIGQRKDGKTLQATVNKDVVVVTERGSGRELLRVSERLIRATVGLDIDPSTKEPVVGALNFDHEARLLAIGNLDTVRIWDVAGQREVATLAGHVGAVTCVAFSPDGRWLASASSGGPIGIWELSSGRRVRTLPWHKRRVVGLRFSPDGKWLASADSNVTKLWNLSPMWRFRTLPLHVDAAYCVAFSRDGKLIASGGGRWKDGPATVRVAEAETGIVLFERDIPKRARGLRIFDVAISPDGKLVAAVGEVRLAKVWNIESGELVLDLPGQVEFRGRGTAVEFEPDGKRLVIAGRRVSVWDLAAEAEIASFSQGANSVAFSPDGTRLFASCGQRFVAWNIASGDVDFDHSLDGAMAWRLAVRPDGSQVALALDGHRLPNGGSGELIEIRDAKTGQLVRRLKIEIQRSLPIYLHNVYGVAFSADGRHLASAGADKTVRVWDVSTGSELVVFEHSNQVFDVQFSPDGRWLASASGHWCGPRPGEVRLWDGQFIQTDDGSPQTARE